MVRQTQHLKHSHRNRRLETATPPRLDRDHHTCQVKEPGYARKSTTSSTPRPEVPSSTPTNCQAICSTLQRPQSAARERSSPPQQLTHTRLRHPHGWKGSPKARGFSRGSSAQNGLYGSRKNGPAKDLARQQVSDYLLQEALLPPDSDRTGSVRVTPRPRACPKWWHRGGRPKEMVLRGMPVADLSKS